MSVVVETTLGTFTVDLYIKERPKASLNFLKLCKIKYYNYNLFHTVGRDFIAQTGDPTGSGKGGQSIFGVCEDLAKRFFTAESQPRMKHTQMGLVSFVGLEDNMIGSQFFVTLAPDLTYLDEKHCIFGEVVEGLETLELLNEAICDGDNRPYQDIRITHTVVLDDPFPDPPRLREPSRSPSPSVERLRGGRIAPDEDIDETAGKDLKEIEEMKAEREAKARATILEMVGDIPDADIAPPENVLFVCKLNPVTTDDDLEIIFSRFGKIVSCEVIRDKKTGDSLQYAFVEFADQQSCENAYFKMDNVLIDDRRIHVDFSQSVAKVKWHGKGRGVTHFDDKGRRTDDKKNNLGKGDYRREEPARRDKREEFRSRNERNYRENPRDRDHKSRRYSREERRPGRPSHDHHPRRMEEKRSERSPERRYNRYSSQSERYEKTKYKSRKEEDHEDGKREDKRKKRASESETKKSKKSKKRRDSTSESDSGESDKKSRKNKNKKS